MTAPVSSSVWAGDPAPWFIARSTSNPTYHFDLAAGRHVVLCFFGSAGTPAVAAMLREFLARTDLFDDQQAVFFGVSADPADESAARVTEQIPGFRFFWDFDGALAARYGVPQWKAGTVPRPASFFLDPGLRVLATVGAARPSAHAAEVCKMVADRLAAAAAAAPAPELTHAPVLVVPNVLEPKLCADLIARFRAHGGEDSGYMTTEPSGATRLVVDHFHKRRRDLTIEDETLRNALQARIRRRLVPAIQRAFQFEVTRIERLIVSQYDATEGGYFRQHRDNTTKGTAHRRFAVTINLNAEEYEGGDLRFPEFGARTYRAPTGGAVVFSCSLLHEVVPITRGTRYCVLPFLYDEAAAKVRIANVEALADPELREKVRATVGAVKE